MARILGARAGDFFTLLIPRQAVGPFAESEGALRTFDDLNCVVSPHDAILRWCMERLSVPSSGIRELQLRKDEAARRLLFRLQELGVGFSSQSHFTTLFSGLTGMTPAKYRKQFSRNVGWRKQSSRAGRLG